PSRDDVTLPGHTYRASEHAGSRSAPGFFSKHVWKSARPPQKIHLGLAHATAEQLRALPAETFWPLDAPFKIAPTPISGDVVLPH
ncbi:hypothetical protein MJM99_34850, partial [Salmonella enterica subsp. enterica serovar Kentucky]|nr:hypothetical protein [Salmonella enterica subsp. enterica serovar Kentucky]